jgi:NAD(P)-dependent dehydrogenase (short-subunit alcohol dehydrogenase family)
MIRVAIVTGGSSGLGKCIMEALNAIEDDPFEVVDWSLPRVDLRSRMSVRESAAAATSRYDYIDVLINCAGINHLEWIPDLKVEDWDNLMDTNARALWLTTKYLCDYMKGGTILNIVSNASHLPMTHSIAYNASKGAAEIMTRQMSRELSKTHKITVFGVSPNKLKGTGMSQQIDKRVCELRGWTPEQAEAYQLSALPAGEETDPKVLAEFIAFLLSTKERHKYLQGCILPYGGPM